MNVNFALENKNFSDLNPIILGYEYCKSKHTYGPSIRKYFLIHYVVSGKGSFSTKKRKYEVSAGSCFVIEPDEVSTYSADEKDPWHYIWVGFDGNLAQRLCELKNPVFKLNSFIFQEMINIEKLTTDRKSVV